MSDVEEVEVRGLQWLDTGHYRKKPPAYGYNPHDWNLLMTVAQHNRIVAQLDARDAGDVRALVEALEHARLFIRNGVELGYIRMPDSDTPDPAHDTLPKIDAALAAHRAKLGD